MAADSGPDDYPIELEVPASPARRAPETLVQHATSNCPSVRGFRTETEMNEPTTTSFCSPHVERHGGPLDFLLDYPRPVSPQFHRDRLPVPQPPRGWSRLWSAADAERVPPFAALLAGLGVFLLRHTGQETIPIGSVIESESGEAKPVVLYLDLAGNPTIRQALRRVDDAMREARQRPAPDFAIADCPFQVVALSHIKDRGRISPDCADWLKQALAMSDLALTAEDGGAEFVLTCSFDEQIFDRSHLAVRLRRLAILLDGLTDICSTVWDLPMLTSDEESGFVTAWSGPPVCHPQHDVIHQLFEEQVRQIPDAVAVWFDAAGEAGAGALTLDQLNRSANRLARELRRRGVRDGDVVGVHLERSPEAVTAILATLKARGVYMPLDPAYPVARLNQMLSDSRSRFMLTSNREDATVFPGFTGVVLPVSIETTGFGLEDEQVVIDKAVTRVSPDEDFCVIYTSGSTGRPKGVLNHHRATLNCFHWMWREYPFAPGEVCCAITSLSFGDSIQEVFGPLLKGVPLVLVPEWVVKSLPKLVATMASHAVTRVILVPSLLRVLLDSFPDLGTQIPSLRLCISSGEALPADLVRRFIAAAPGCRLVNMYGTSELANDVTFWEVTSQDADVRLVPIGRPIDNVLIYILDRNGRPVPCGAPGELLVGGAGVGHGYLNRAELTAQRFLLGESLPDPLGSQLWGERLYRTGDLARSRPDGVIEYLGRIDQQVKIRGFRIELEEIESTLSEYPGVCQAAVALREEPTGDKRLVAYVVPDLDEIPEIDEIDKLLREFLRERLPEFMVPTTYVTWLKKLPMTLSGKVDRAALPAPNPPPQPRNISPTRGATEKALANLWAKILWGGDHGDYAIDRDASFRDLGGHSLAAALMVVWIQREFRVMIDVRTIQTCDRLAELAMQIDRLRDTGK